MQFCRSLLPVIIIRVPMQMKRVCRNIQLHYVLITKKKIHVPVWAMQAPMKTVQLPLLFWMMTFMVRPARGEYFVRHMCIYMHMFMK